jgi:KipI family sensor histidine kinase inhibitor
MQELAAGDRGTLFELGDVTAAELRHAAARMRAREGVLACIVGHSSLYVIWSVGQAILPVPDRQGCLSYTIPVLFDGEDLHKLPDIASRIADLTLTARYLGFRAGFAYLDGWPAEWRLPRRATSRPVARGSFAVAGAMAGFYPIDTPGGWNILGRTNVTLWDPLREPPNLIAPGDSIRIVPVMALPPPEPLLAAPEPSGDVIAEVIAPGQLTRIVGKRDWSRVESGVPPGGPFDDDAARAANRSVGNCDDAALLECVLVAPKLRFARPTRVGCWDGGRVYVETVSELDLGRLKSLRGYIAVEGGVDEMRGRYVEEPTRLVRGMLLRGAGDRSGGMAAALQVLRSERLVIRVMPGPHRPHIEAIECEVTNQLDRVGIRLRPLSPVPPAPPDLPSYGMQCGTVQLHPDGSLVAMGPDHPVTGGYLQPMTVLSTEIWKLAQLMPGERIRFVS